MRIFGYHTNRAERAVNQTEIGDQLYFFRSERRNAAGHADPDMANCLVMAHAGHSLEDNSLKGVDDFGRFVVPAGVTVHFYVPHGDTANNPSVQTHIHENRHVVSEDIAAGGKCFNYRLSKVLGHGADTAEEMPRDYNMRVQEFMVGGAGGVQNARSWAPNVVTVRNRLLSSSSITLQDLITQVRRVHPSMSHFHMLACRAVFTKGVMLPHTAIKV